MRKNVVSASYARRLAKKGIEVVGTKAVPNAEGSFAEGSIVYVIVEDETQRMVSPTELWAIAEL